MDRWELEKRIALECVKNPKFKKKFIAQPNEAVAELLKQAKGFDAALLQKVHFTAHEEKKNEMCISIPFGEAGHLVAEEELKELFAGCDTPFSTNIS